MSDIPEINAVKIEVGDLSKEIYEDGAKETVKEFGKIAALVPKAINAALFPLQVWIAKANINHEVISRRLEEKLKNVSPENIVIPEMYIAVPAIQSMSYCMENKILRDMYANLLASSMNKVVKNNVQPGFVDIIRQITPDEAKILLSLDVEDAIPIITLSKVNKQGGRTSVIKDFSDIGEKASCEFPYKIKQYFDNLIRLGILEGNSYASILTDDSSYQKLITNTVIAKKIEEIEASGFEPDIITGEYLQVTDFGKAFCATCISHS